MKSNREQRTYLCIDLKSFYASVECRERGLDPLTANLVVADPERTEKTICLAVSPSLKQYGIGGRARLFEVVSKVKLINKRRKAKYKIKEFTGESADDNELKKNHSLAVSYITAVPRMALYMKYSTSIYAIYLKYISAEDIHVYSIDEVFMDITSYLELYKKTPEELAAEMIAEVYKATGITATAGIGTNLYLSKIAMDIVAKHIEPDKNGCRIASLDEMKYRKLLWDHRPITDFWRVGRGYAKRLYDKGIYTMGDIAKCSLGEEKDFYNEDTLYDMFGINAELLIDHAWGYEPCTIKDIKNFKPENNCLSSGQVLHCPYDYEKGEIIVKEMADSLALSLVDKKLLTDQIVLTIGFDIENLSSEDFDGEIEKDYYGRKVPKPAHGTINLKKYTSSSRLITEGVVDFYRKNVDKNLFIRRINITANHVAEEDSIPKNSSFEQMDIFSDDSLTEENIKKERKEKKIQNTVVKIKKQYGKNSIVRGMNMQKDATAMERNNQIGGHRA